MEKILKIEEIYGYRFPDGTKDVYGTYSGYQITTSEQEIYAVIDDVTACCESWGYLISQDDFKHFIGAELLKISLTDTGMCTTDDVDFDDGETAVIFVNFDTSEGTLQFTAYNSHNGYYGHSVVLKSKQLNITDTL